MPLAGCHGRVMVLEKAPHTAESNQIENLCGRQVAEQDSRPRIKLVVVSPARIEGNRRRLCNGLSIHQ